MIRESSPPDAIPSSGPNGSPGFGAMRKATRSAPLASGSSGSSATVNRQRSRPRSPSCASTLFASLFALFSRAVWSAALAAVRASRAARSSPSSRARRSSCDDTSTLELAGIGVDALAVPPELRAEIRDLVHRGRKTGGVLGQARVELRGGGEIACRDREAVACGGSLADQDVVDRRRARAQPLRRSRDAERGREVRVLAALDVRRLDLFYLVLEEGEPARSFARIAAERGALGDDVAERAMRRRGRATEARVLAVRVEEIALHRGAREPQLLALTVDRDEIRAALGELRERNGLAVHARGRAAGLDFAREDEVFVTRAGEHRLDASAFGAFAHHPGGDASARRREQRVDEHRLAGTGFAREDREPGRELEPKL